MENKEISIETLLNEYNKYIMSRLINKEYDFTQLRQILKEFAQNTNIIEYNDEMSNQQVANCISKFIRESTNGKNKFEL